MRFLLARASLALATVAIWGCEGGFGGATRDPVADDYTADLPILPAGAEPAIPQPLVGFDFDAGNAAVEVVIPAVIPVIFANVAPGDATIVLRFTTLLTNAWFDATAPYHPTAVGVRLLGADRPVNRRPTRT